MKVSKGEGLEQKCSTELQAVISKRVLYTVTRSPMSTVSLLQLDLYMDMQAHYSISNRSSQAPTQASFMTAASLARLQTSLV
jgi:hypothetical protein